MDSLRIGDRVIVDSMSMYTKHVDTKGTIVDLKWNLYKIKFDNSDSEWIVNTFVKKLD